VQFSRPTIWVFCGLPASGKSTLAEKTAEALDLPLIQSDRIRKGGAWPLHSEEGVVPYGQGVYRKELRQMVYSHMLALAQENLKRGRSVVLDATFSTARWRDEARLLANDVDCNILFIECTAELEALRERMRSREGLNLVSDARLEHLDYLVRGFEPLDEIPRNACLKVDTGKPATKCLGEILANGYAMKCTQIRKLIEE
jgi:predicted kinase